MKALNCLQILTNSLINSLLAVKVSINVDYTSSDFKNILRIRRLILIEITPLQAKEELNLIRKE